MSQRPPLGGFSFGERMKRICSALLFLACSAANAQFVTGQILTAAQLNAAFANVLSLSGGTLTGPFTVQGNTTLTNLTVNGTFTVPGGFSPASISPAGSTAGQAIVSPGPAGPAGWGNVSAAALTGITPAVNGGTGVTTAAAELSRIGAAPLAGATFTGPVTLSYSSPIFTLNDTSGTSKASLLFNKNGVTAWGWGNSSTPNALAVDRYVSGSYADSPISVANATGIVTMSDGVAGTPISGSTGSFTTLSASGLISPTSTIGIKATATNDSVQAGSVGEQPAPVTGSALALTSATSINLTSISLAAGNWLVQCTASFVATSPSAMTNATVGISQTSLTLGVLGTLTGVSPTGTASAGFSDTLPTPLVPLKLCLYNDSLLCWQR